MITKFPKFSQSLANDPTTRRLWYGIATAHDFESHDDMTEEALYQKIFASHFGQLAIIFLWTSGNLFHVAWQGNFEQWVLDPLHIRPIAHAIWDPHFGQAAVEAFTRGGTTSGPVNIATSGVYQWWYTIGCTSNQDLYQGAVFLLIVSGVFLFAGWLHLQPKFQPTFWWFKNAESRLNHHLAGLFGISSLAWTGHLVHVAIPQSRGISVRWSNFLTTLPHPKGLTPFFTGNWNAYSQNPDTGSHLFGTYEGSGDAILTFLGGFHPQTQSLWLTDIAHHHLAIAVIFIIAGHMYRTNFGIGHSLKEILEIHFAPSGRLGTGHSGLFDVVNNSLHFQLGLALASLGTICSLVAQHMYSLPAYAFLAQDFTTQAALYTHHQYIAGFIMCGAFAHGAIFFIRDYDPILNKNNVLARILDHKEAIISHLSWVSLFLGFHTLGLYIHNDVMLAFGTPEKQILIEPLFAQWIQAAHGKNLYGFDVFLSNDQSPAYDASQTLWLPGWLSAINNKANSLFLIIGPGDFLVHHAVLTTALLALMVFLLGFGVLSWRQNQRLAAERDIALREKARAELVAQFLVDSFEQADPNRNRGEQLTAREILESGARQVSRELEGEPELEAELLVVLGRVHVRLGLYEQARPLLERALELRQKHLPRDHLSIAESLHEWAELLHDEGEFDEAEKTARQAVALRRTRNPQKAAQSLHLLARIRRAQDAREESITLHKQALEIQRLHLGNEHPEVVHGLVLLARGLRFRGLREPAAEILEEALTIQERLFPGDHPDTGRLLVEISRLLKVNSRLAEAEIRAERALSMNRRLFGNVHPSVSSALNALASIHRELGEFEEAGELYQESLDLERRLLGTENLRFAIALYNQAYFLHLSLGRPAEAVPLFEEALEIAIRTVGEEHVNAGFFGAGLGGALVDLGRAHEAEPLLRQALDLFERQSSGGSTGRNANWARSELAGALLHQGRQQEAKALLRKALPVLEEDLGAEHEIVKRTRQRVESF